MKQIPEEVLDQLLEHCDKPEDILLKPIHSDWRTVLNRQTCPLHKPLERLTWLSVFATPGDIGH